MKYLFFTKDALDVKISRLLAESIASQDVRAEIWGHDTRLTRKESVEVIAQHKPDVLLFVGRVERRLLSKAKRLSIPTILLQSTAKDAIHKKRTDKFILDFPEKSQRDHQHYRGNLLFDALRKMEIGSVDQPSDTRIAVVYGFERNAESSASKIMTRLKARISHDIVLANLEEDFVRSMQIINSSNVAIVLGEVAEVVATFFNCPYLKVVKKRWGNVRKYSLINNALNQSVAQVFASNATTEIKGEILTLLEDPQYCAAQLESIQAFKEQVGNQPITRAVVRDLIEWLEER